MLVIDDLHLVDDEPTVAESLAAVPAAVCPRGCTWSWPPGDRPSCRSIGCGCGPARPSCASTNSASPPRRLGRCSTSWRPACSEDRLAIAVERADGWVASLQLAALAARSQRARATQDVPGVDESVLIHDYVMQEVLAGEDAKWSEPCSKRAVVERCERRARPRRSPATSTPRACCGGPRSGACSSPGSAPRAGSACTPWSAPSSERELSRQPGAAGPAARPSRPMVRRRWRHGGRPGSSGPVGRPPGHVAPPGRQAGDLYDNGREGDHPPGDRRHTPRARRQRPRRPGGLRLVPPAGQPAPLRRARGAADVVGGSLRGRRATRRRASASSPPSPPP